MMMQFPARSVMVSPMAAKMIAGSPKMHRISSMTWRIFSRRINNRLFPVTDAGV